MTRPSQNSNKVKKIPIRSKWVFLSLYILFSGFIVFECSLSAVASADQTGWIASLLAGIVNSITPAKSAETIEPIAFSLSPDERFVGANNAIEGKTKVIDYTLQYESQGTNYVYVCDSAITYEREDGSSEADYEVFISSSSASGQIRLVPYVTRADCKIVFSTSNGIEAEYTFDCIERPAPSLFSLPSLDIEIEVGETYSFEPTLYCDPHIGNDVLLNETEDHYLQRIYDYEKIEKSSDDPSIAAIDDRFGVVKGIGPGQTTINYGDKSVAITVVSSTFPPIAVDSVSIDQSSISGTLDDFSSWSSGRQGTQLTAHALPSNAPQGLHFYSETPLIAMVSNEHRDSDEPGTAVPGGFVQGYLKEGTTYIYAVSDADPTKFARCEVLIEKVLPTSVSYSYSLAGGGAVDFANGPLEVTSGDVLSIVPNFTPSTVLDQTIVAVSSDSAIAKVLSSGTVSPQISFLGIGEATVTLSANGNPALPSTMISFSVKSAPYIPSNQMGSFSHLVRKTGHCICFVFSSAFLFLFLLQVFDKKKLWWLSALISLIAGLILAGLTEGIQYFIPRRTPSWFDILIDASGVLIGVATIGLFLFLRRLIKKKGPAGPKDKPKT